MEGDHLGTPEQLRNEVLTQAAQAKLRKDGDTAIQLWVKCCALSRIIFGDTHVELARCHIELANVYLELKGYWEQALSHAIKGRDILLLAKKHMTSHDVQPLALYYHSWACCIIGRVQTTRGQLKEAVVSLCDAEMMYGECGKAIGLGPSSQAEESGTHHVTMVTIVRLEEEITCAAGRLALKQKDFESAKSYFTKAVDHHTSHHGNSSEGLVILLRELARTEGCCGNRPAAVKALSTALDISRSKHGEESEEVAQVCRALASVHLSAMKEALMSSECADDVITSPSRIMAQLSTEDAAEVEHLLRRAQGIMSSVLGEDHCETIECKEDLTRLFLLTSQYKEAVHMQKGVVKSRKSVYGIRSREVAYSYKLLGTAYVSAGMVEESRKCLEKAMNIYSAVLGENHKETVCVLRSLDLIAGFGFSDHHDGLHSRPQFRTVV